MRRPVGLALVIFLFASGVTRAQRYTTSDGRLRVALAQQLARLFETIFRRYPKASAIGFATIPSRDEGGLSIAAVNRMIEGAIRGVKAREAQRQ